ncbi:uncharacterized protein LOC134534125 isoform X2 [Bacillus rossius redtenbacheri]
MPRKKSLLGRCQRKSAPVPTRQLRLFSAEFSGATCSSNRPSRNTERKSRIPLGRTMRHLSLESRERVPSRRSRSAFATPDSPSCWKEQRVMSTQRKTLHTPLSIGSIQPWLSTTKKVGKGMKAQTDKYEQAAMVVKIQDHFARQDLDMNLIPLSGLHQRIMTLNLFVGLTSHLLASFYPHHGISMSNYTEKIPQFMKTLGYAGNVTKSWLRTANNSHSWPNVLKLLSWLVDLVEKKDKVRTHMFSKSEEEPDDEFVVSAEELFDYYLNTYILWDQEQIDDIEVATSQLEKKYNEGLCSEEELKALSEEIEQIKQRFEDPQDNEEESKFQQIKMEHDSLQEDFLKISAELEAQEGEINSLQQQLCDLSVQKEKLEADCQAKQSLLKQKMKQLSTQKVSLEEKQLFDKNMNSVRVEIDNLKAMKQKRMEEIFKKDMEISQLLRNVSEENNKFRRNLQKFDDPRVQELVQTKSDSQEEIIEILSDIESAAKKSLLDIKKQLPGITSNLEKVKRELQNANAELEEERVKIKSLCASLEKLDQNLKQREAEHMFESQQFLNKIKRNKGTAHSVELEEARAKLKAATEELEKLRELRASNAQAALEIMSHLYADFEKFRAKIKDEDIVQKALEMVGSIRQDKELRSP